MKVMAILVAYESPVLELITAIERISKQVDFVVVCNNSARAFEYSAPNVAVLNFLDNLGIAKAQSLGMAWAFEHGADFVLQMDQDSEATQMMVAKLLEAYCYLTEHGYKVGLVGAQDFDKFTQAVSRPRVNKGKVICGTDYVVVSEVLSSGSLIPKAAYDAVGGMDDRLFIDVVDFEYCWRLKAHGFLVVKNPNALLGHRLGEGTKKILGLLSVGVPAPFRHYYSFRNTIHLMKRGYSPRYWRFSSLAKMMFKLMVYPFAQDDGRGRLHYMLAGIYDGLRGKYGRIPEK